MNKLQQCLTRTFATNFLLYYKSHVAHVNTVGRNFHSDHKLLEEIYSDAQGNIDVLAEFLRTIDAKMPSSLEDVCLGAETSDGISGDADKLLDEVYYTIEDVLAVLEDLIVEAEELGELGIANYAQERLVVHKKQCWMIRATLEK